MLVPLLTVVQRSARGFDPHPRDPARCMSLGGGEILDADRLRYLHRSAGWVRILDGSDPERTAGSVVGLALAGVPVGTVDLGAATRALLPPDLLAVADGVDAESVGRDDLREVTSLRLRRVAQRMVRRLPGDPVHLTVAVLLDVCGASGRLLADLAYQTWPRVLLVVEESATPDEMAGVRKLVAGRAGWELVEHSPGEEGLDSALAECGAPLVTRVTPALAYGPHHLEDLAQAVGGSGARLARSPDRFHLRAPSSSVLERLDLVGDVLCGRASTLPGGALWYATQGSREPDGEGYLVHGANAVRWGPTTDADLPAIAWTHHRTPPATLAWLPMSGHAPMETLRPSALARSLAHT